MNRRHFLASAAVTASAAALCRGPFASLAVAAERPPWRLRLTLSSVMFAELPIEQVCERAAKLGFEALDIWCPFDRCKHLDDVQQRFGADGLRDLLAKHRLRLGSFSVYGAGFPKYAELIGKFGGGVVVRESEYGQIKPEEVTARMRTFFEKLKPQIDLAAEEKARLAIENHGNALLDGLDAFKAFVDLNPAPKQVGIALAPLHLQASNASVEEAVRLSGSQLLFFYAWQKGDGFNQLPGHGPTDFTPWLQALAKINYAHTVSPFMHGNVAPEEMEKAVIKARDYLKECHRKAVAAN